MTSKILIVDYKRQKTKWLEESKIIPGEILYFSNGLVEMLAYSKVNFSRRISINEY